jgi:hypothetical protein
VNYNGEYFPDFFHICYNVSGDNFYFSFVHRLDNVQQATCGFVQAGLDVQTSAVCIAVLWFGLDGILLGF